MSGLSVVSLVLQVTAVVATVAGAKSIACRSTRLWQPEESLGGADPVGSQCLPEDAGRRLDVASLGSRAHRGLDRSCGHRASPSSWRAAWASSPIVS